MATPFEGNDDSETLRFLPHLIVSLLVMVVGWLLALAVSSTAAQQLPIVFVHGNGDSAALHGLIRAIAGVPLLSGFFSKDEILWKAFSSGHQVVWLMAWLAAGLGGALDGVPLAVVEADGLDVAESVQRPGQADGGILPAGEQHEGAALVLHRRVRSALRPGRAPPTSSR